MKERLGYAVAFLVAASMATGVVIGIAGEFPETLAKISQGGLANSLILMPMFVGLLAGGTLALVGIALLLGWRAIRPGSTTGS